MNRLIQSDVLRPGHAVRRAVLLAAFVFGVLVARPVVAQPANDNFSAAQLVAGGWGSVTNDNTGATAELGEPSHAGIAASQSIWYKWVAPSDGEVTVDTYGSLDPTSFINPNLDTRLAVYSGTDVTLLRQVAANNDIFPLPFQDNIDYTLGASFGLSLYSQLLPGPSVVKFNATA